MEDVKNFLKDKDCLMLFSIEKAGDRRFIKFHTPARQIKPISLETDTEFDILPTGIEITINGEVQESIELPPYTLKAFVMSVVIATCERYGYNIKLVEFELDGRKVDAIEFTKHMLNFSLDDEDEKKDNLLRELTSNAVNCPIKFHPEFETRAVDLGIDDGYKRVKHILSGGNIYE